MNIDILNAYCGLGHSRGHARLRVGLQYRSRVARTSPARWTSRRSLYSCGEPAGHLRPVVAPPDRRVVSNLELTPLLERAVAMVRRRRRCSPFVVVVGSSSKLSLRGETVARSCIDRRRRRVVDRHRRLLLLLRRGVVALSRFLRPEIGRDYPLNLSILISGGKETNQDSPSNGE